MKAGSTGLSVPARGRLDPVAALAGALTRSVGRLTTIARADSLPSGEGKVFSPPRRLPKHAEAAHANRLIRRVSKGQDPALESSRRALQLGAGSSGGLKILLRFNSARCMASEFYPNALWRGHGPIKG